MAFIGIAILLIVLIPLIVAAALFAAALWTLRQLLHEHEWTGTASAPAREPLDVGELVNAPAPARSLP